MKIKGLSKFELETALKNVNEQHGYELIFNRLPEWKGNYLHFTIRSRRSGIKGSRYSSTGRRLVSASWHAHGYLFDEIFYINPDAVIKALGKTITVESGNWEDMQVGGIMYPVYMSELSIC